MNVIQQYEAREIQRLTQKLAEEGKAIPDFAPGDTLKVHVRITEGERSRIQVFEGLCIARSNASLRSSFRVRKISYGEGVERSFPLYSPNIDLIEVIRRGKVRRAKLYYLRDLTGKAARIKEKVDHKRRLSRAAAQAPMGIETVVTTAE